MSRDAHGASRAYICSFTVVSSRFFSSEMGRSLFLRVRQRALKIPQLSPTSDVSVNRATPVACVAFAILASLLFWSWKFGENEVMAQVVKRSAVGLSGTPRTVSRMLKLPRASAPPKSLTLNSIECLGRHALGTRLITQPQTPSSALEHTAPTICGTDPHLPPPACPSRVALTSLDSHVESKIHGYPPLPPPSLCLRCTELADATQLPHSGIPVVLKRGSARREDLPPLAHWQRPCPATTTFCACAIPRFEVAIRTYPGAQLGRSGRRAMIAVAIGTSRIA
ncbi:hypothetical protein P154DRAFT_110421 [Amniculicola lignicola CBS 123094]|uniref:Uncharacterized protein n=1 Tax=Amniculicola lignicola CBS 123094 TaxID=1392246 RepID=A0A6A5WSC6_9PLEO|nr:hypothetical protein P154DRAFT_110421 [Amniculicola lignicola CBS 123094]